MDLDPRLHFVVVTGIVARPRSSTAAPVGSEARQKRQGKRVFEFLIAKRAAHEKAFPNKWTVPGGKLVRKEYENLPPKPFAHDQKASEAPQWYNLIEWVLRKEVKEEVGVEIESPKYLCDLVFIRPDGYPVATLSYWAMWKSGEAKPGKDLTEVAWVTVEEAKKYDLIEGIWEEIRDVNSLLQ